MTIQVYPYNQEEEKALLDFLNSRHYNYKEAVEDETGETDAEFLDQYNKELDESEAQIAAGNYVSHDDVKKFLAERRKRISGN